MLPNIRLKSVAELPSNSSSLIFPRKSITTGEGGMIVTDNDRLAEKLRMMEPVNSPRIKAVVLAGSVLRRDFPWVDIKKNLNLPLVVNDCGIKDFPLILSEIFAPGLGMAGKKGFYTFENGVVTNRFFNGGHSFFEKKTDFYTEYWLPIIRGDEPVPSPKIRISKYHDFLESFTDGIKYYFWGVALFLLSLSIIF